MTDLERARELFSQRDFSMKVVGCQIDEVGPGYARCSLPIRADLKNGLDIVMGGAIYTLADLTYGVAANLNRDVFVTSSSNIYFLKPATGTVLTAEAKEVRAGRRTCLFEVCVRDDAGDEVAHASISGMMVKKREKKS